MKRGQQAAASILIVDDQPSNVMLLEGILQEEDFTSYRSITDSREVLPTFIDYLPDLILLDLQMPYLDGFAVMKQLQACIAPTDFLPILVLTADITPEAKRRALSEGALDFLTKPFDATEVVLRIKNLLQTRFLHLLYFLLLFHHHVL
jgi:PleD family two-component response regulator